MGYNGGTNKRGYYRRFNGMQSKSTYKSGEKILENAILGSLGLVALAGKAVVDMAENAPMPTESNRKHFSPNSNRIRCIICGILIILCPIAGFITFEFYDWWIFFSVLLFGLLELIPSLLCSDIKTDLNLFSYYYQDEAETLIPKCKQNIKITLGFFIAALILNLYPVVYFILDLTIGRHHIGRFFDYVGGEGITIFLVGFKLFINALLIHMAHQSLKTIEPFILKHGRKRISEKESASSTSNQCDFPCTSSRAIEIIKDYRIQRAIKRYWKNEIFFYFYEDLMDEAAFDKQEFGKNFRKDWFTYEEYLKHWKDTHWELRFCTKAYELALEITRTEIITLQDFKDPSLFAKLIDDALMGRLEEEEVRAYHRIKHNDSSLWGMIIFDYHKCRNLKLDAKDDRFSIDYSLHSLRDNYRDCLNKALKSGGYSYDNFTEFAQLIKEVENGEILLENPNKISQNAIEKNQIECNDSEIKLPKISGEYVESFYGSSGDLHIKADCAYIQFYFPGRDLRHKGTFFNIAETEIDNYIQAYKLNWLKAQELFEKAQELPNTLFNIVGEKGMNISVSQSSINIYLYQYHLPIGTEEQCQDIIRKFQEAQLRIKEIRKKLFE